jgi:formamidopyrimidine-DNA glycosylase
MPELPDLEVFRENLVPLVVAKKITGVKVLKNKVIGSMSEKEFASRLVGQRIESISRRAKHLIFKLSSGDELILHLMLHGELYHLKTGEPVHPFTCVIFNMEDGFDLRFQDKTQWMKLSFDKGMLDGLGVEPLSDEFTLERFRSILGKNRGMIKPLLMAQEEIAGIGHAYADEILFDAGILPQRKVQELKNEEIKKLYNSIRNVLKDSINKVRKGLKGGITGEFREFVMVRGREGQPCYRCRTIIKSKKVGGQNAYFCPKCQK